MLAAPEVVFSLTLIFSFPVPEGVIFVYSIVFDII